MKKAAQFHLTAHKKKVYNIVFDELADDVGAAILETAETTTFGSQAAKIVTWCNEKPSSDNSKDNF